MFNLWGKIRVDGTEAKKDAAKAGQSIAQSMGKEMRQQFKGGIMRFLGAGAVLGFATGQMGRAGEITRGASRMGIGTDAFQELEMLAEKFGISVEEAREMGRTDPLKFVSAMESIRGSKGILDKETVSGLKEASDAVKELKIEATPAVAKSANLATRALRFPGESMAGWAAFRDLINTKFGSPANAIALQRLISLQESQLNELRGIKDNLAPTHGASGSW